MQFTITPVAVLRGHDDRAWQLAWNPTKPLLASCSSDKTIRLYHYTNTNFSHLTTIETGHTKTVRSIAWSPSGVSLAAGSFDSTVSIWSQELDEDGIPSGAEWECSSLLQGHDTECKGISYSSSGNFMATCSRDKVVWIWEVLPDADYSCETVLMEHSQDVKCVAWHPSEEILASASYDDSIKIYEDDPDDEWYCFTTLKGHASTVWSIAWSPNGQYLASASDDRTIRIWKRISRTDFQSVLTLEGHDRAVYSISWSVGKGATENLGWIASTGSDGVVNVWEMTEDGVNLRHNLIAKLTSAHNHYDVNTVVWCPRPGYEDFLATAGDDGLVKVWQLSRA